MLSRREFLGRLALALDVIFSGCLGKKPIIEEDKKVQVMEKASKSKVYIIKTGDRESGIRELLKNFNPGNMTGKKVILKANYNSAHEFPASTHPDTLSVLIDAINENGGKAVLAERSGMGKTRDVLEEMGVMELSKEKGFDVVILDDLKSNEWVKAKGSTWRRGFLFPRIINEADMVIQTCCLKTHRFGGHFTMSLKNSVGLVAKIDPDDGYNYMSELHLSRYQRLMIAELNTVYSPEFVIMDAIEGFSTEGPEGGTLIEPGLLIASSDRVALDAVGVSILRLYGTTREVSRGNIFRQEQILKAAELGIGASSFDEMELVPLNNDAQEICSLIEDMFNY